MFVFLLCLDLADFLTLLKNNSMNKKWHSFDNNVGSVGCWTPPSPKGFTARLLSVPVVFRLKSKGRSRIYLETLLWWQPSIMLESGTFGSKLVSVRRLLLTSPWHIIQLLGGKKNCLGSPSSRLTGKFSKILMALMALFPRFYSVVIDTSHLSVSPCIPGGRRSGRELYYIGISTRLVTNDRHKAPSSEFFIQFSIFHH